MADSRNKRRVGEFHIIRASGDILAMSEDRRWYCLSDRQVAAILSQTPYLSWPTRWHDLQGVSKSDLQAFAASIENDLMIECECPAGPAGPAGPVGPAGECECDGTESNPPAPAPDFGDLEPFTATRWRRCSDYSVSGSARVFSNISGQSFVDSGGLRMRNESIPLSDPPRWRQVLLAKTNFSAPATITQLFAQLNIIPNSFVVGSDYTWQFAIGKETYTVKPLFQGLPGEAVDDPLASGYVQTVALNGYWPNVDNIYIKAWNVQSVPNSNSYRPAISHISISGTGAAPLPDAFNDCSVSPFS